MSLSGPAQATAWNREKMVSDMPGTTSKREDEAIGTEFNHPPRLPAPMRDRR